MNNKFIYGYIKFYTNIKTLTGLRVGGRRETIEIGGIDLQAIKDPEGFPYIPGSSLKGKIRSLVEKLNNIFGTYEKKDISSKEEIDSFFREIEEKLSKGGYNGEPFGIKLEVKVSEGIKKILINYILERISKDKIYFVIRVFGNHKGDPGLEPRLIVRDFILDEDKTKKSLKLKEIKPEDLLEIKVENVVNRVNGKAEHPREVERVRKGVIFKGEMIYKLLGWGLLSENEVLQQAKEELEKLKQAIIYLIKYDYLGSSGTRGYGKIALWFDKIEVELDGKKITLILDVRPQGFSVKVKGEQNELTDYLKKFMEEIYLVALQEANRYNEQI